MTTAPPLPPATVETRFGTFPVAAADIVHFAHGLPGFEACRQFVLISAPELLPFTCLHGIDAPGPSFLIQTENGLASVTSSRVLTPGRHHLAGTYDGRTIRLYVDGCLEAERAASGRLVASALPVTVGRMACGSAVLDGVVIEAEVTGSAKNPAEIAGFLDRASASAV